MFSNLNKPKRKWKVLIVDDVHESLPDGLKNVGHEVLYLPNANRSEIIQNLPGKNVLVIRTKTIVDLELMDAGSELSIIARAGAGLDNIDTTLASERKIKCINAAEANAVAVAEHSLGMLLMGLNNLGRANSEVKNGIWKREENRGIELSGKTVAIIGYGNTGSAFAGILSGMGVKMLAYDKYLSGFGNEKVLESSWEEIYEEADVLSFHVPLTEETYHYLNKEKLNKFKKPVFLLNLSRGKVVKTEDLIEGLLNGKIWGCALDVLEKEDLKSLNEVEKKYFDFLAGNEKVILTPHIGGWTKESYVKISSVLLKKLLTLGS